MDTLCSIVGMPLFMSSVLNTWVKLEEGKLGKDALEESSSNLRSTRTLPPVRAAPSKTAFSYPSLLPERAPSNTMSTAHDNSASNTIAPEVRNKQPKQPPDVLGSPRLLLAPHEQPIEKAICISSRPKEAAAILKAGHELCWHTATAAVVVERTCRYPKNFASVELSMVDATAAVVAESACSSPKNVASAESSMVTLKPPHSQELACTEVASKPALEQDLPLPGALEIAPEAHGAESIEACIAIPQAVVQQHIESTSISKSAEPSIELSKGSELEDRTSEGNFGCIARPAGTSLLHEVQDTKNAPAAVQPSPTATPEDLAQFTEEFPAICTDVADPTSDDELSEKCLRNEKADIKADPTSDDELPLKVPRHDKGSASKRKEQKMRRCISTPQMPGGRQLLPPLPKVPVAISNVVRIAHAVDAWKTQHFIHLRNGNVVEANKDCLIGDHEVKLGQRGRVVHTAYEISVDVLMDGATEVIHVPKKDFANFKLHVVTHEVELINTMGRRTGKFVACMVLRDHEDGFYDILCQDGRSKEFVCSSYVRELSTGMYTDVGYVSARSSSSGSNSTLSDQKPGPWNPNPGRSCGGVSRTSGLELPPEGFLGDGLASSFADGSILTIARSRSQAGKRHEETRRDDAPQSHSRSSSDGAGLEHGVSVCPFMEIQDGGLRAFTGICSFGVNDTVVDIGWGYGKILNKILQCCPCQGIGVEVNYSIARIAEQRLRKYAQRAKVVIDDIRNVDLRHATATVSYLLSHSFTTNGGALKEHLSNSLRPGCLVFNYTYPVPGWSGSLQNGVYKYIIGEHLKGEGK